MKIQRIWEVGDKVVAKSDGFYGVTIKNDVGGTETLPKGRYKVMVTKQWEDYETGQRLIGTLQDEKDIAVARKKGTTGHANDPRMATLVREQKPWDPKVVYFSEHHCEPMRNQRAR